MYARKKVINIYMYGKFPITNLNNFFYMSNNGDCDT